MQYRHGAPGGGGGVRHDGPTERAQLERLRPQLSIELREDRTGRWYILRDRSDDLEQVGAYQLQPRR
jgi:hypothetical protein